MAEELEPIDISHLDEVRRLVEEVQAAKKARALRVNGETVAILVPASRQRSPSRRRKATSAADPLWTMVGIGSTDGPGDAAETVGKIVPQLDT